MSLVAVEAIDVLRYSVVFFTFSATLICTIAFQSSCACYQIIAIFQKIDVVIDSKTAQTELELSFVGGVSA